MGRYLMSSRVGALKWLGALQLVFGLLLLAVTVGYFGIDFEKNSRGTATAFYVNHVLFTIPTILMAFGAGAAGVTMSRFKGLIHNISARNTAVALSLMNALAAMLTIALSGCYIFYDVDKRDIFDNDARYWEKAVGALIVINIVICLFDWLIAIAFVTLGCLWMPSESGYQAQPVQSSSHPPPPPADPYYRRPEPEVVETYYPNAGRYGYPNGGYYPGASAYPGGGYRTLPALKY